MSSVERGGSQGRPARLFVYGTLQPGRLRWPTLERYAEGHRPASVPGRIYDAGYGWPVADFERSDAQVPGTLVDLDRRRLDEALLVLDEVEATATDLLGRILITTTDGERAWTYHCHRVLAGFTQIERWDSPVEH